MEPFDSPPTHGHIVFVYYEVVLYVSLRYLGCPPYLNLLTLLGGWNTPNRAFLRTRGRSVQGEDRTYLAPVASLLDVGSDVLHGVAS